MSKILLPAALILAMASPAMAATYVLPSQPLVSKGVFVVRQVRNPTFAAAASAFFPGGGQIYDDEPVRWMIATALLGLTGYFTFTSPNSTVKIVSGTAMGLSWLWSIGDAYVSARAYNHQIIEQAMP